MLVGGQASAKSKHSLSTYRMLGPLVPHGVGWCLPSKLLMAAMPPPLPLVLGKREPPWRHIWYHPKGRWDIP